MKQLKDESIRRLRKVSVRRGDRPGTGSKATENVDSSGNGINENSSNRQLAAPVISEGEGSHSRPGSAASSNKALPGLPKSSSSAPAITVEASPDLQNLNLASPSPSSCHQLLPAPPSAPYMNAASNASSNASENWTAPEDADGAYIRKTYAYFDSSGIKGDGIVEGKEWTREKGAKAAWDASSTFRANGICSGEIGAGEANLKVPATTLTQTSSRRRSSCISSEKEELPRSPRAALTPAYTANESPADSNEFLGDQSRESFEPAEGEGKCNAVTAEDAALEEERKEMMKNVDRYGFFNKEGQSATRSRITIVPARSLQSLPKRRMTPKRMRKNRQAQSEPSSDSPGPNDNSTDTMPRSKGEKPPKSTQSTLHSVMATREKKDVELREREALRVAKWDRMLEVKRAENEPPCYILAEGTSRTNKFRRRVYKGIPDRWRSAAWWAILLQQGEGQPAMMQSEKQYKDLLSMPSLHDVQIDLDVPRTISGHILFHTRYGQGQRSLFHVLHAFSQLCPQCGYCQGMGPIVATLLVYFTPDKAFSVMVQLHNQSLYGLHDTFYPGFPGLVENFYVQKKMCERLCPEVDHALETEGIVTSAYATKWYITLFTNVLPFSTQVRLWDCFLLQGKDVLVIVSIAILWSLRDRIISGGFETSMKLLTRDFLPVDDDALLTWIYAVMGREDTRRRLAAARAEYAELVKQGRQPVL